MTQETLLQGLRDGGIHIIARFLDMKPEEILVLIQHNLLEDKLEEAYSQMPEDELVKFQNEITFNRSPESSDKPSAWAELRNDHIEEENGFIIVHIDAFKTDDDNEEGEVIAKVIGVNLANNEPSVYISYQNVIAMVDEYAQEVILEAKEDVMAQLYENAYSTAMPPIIGRTRIALDTDKVIHVYVTTQQPGAKEQVAVARISALNIKPNSEVRAKPVAHYLLPGKPSPEVAAEIQAAIDDLTAELHKK